MSKTSSIFTGRKAGIKITYVGLFWFVALYGRICTDYPQIWQGEVATNILSLPKLKIFGGHLGNTGPKKNKKLRNNLENARK